MLNAARITGASISTHALTEGDVAPILFSTPSRIISTHALTEGDHGDVVGGTTGDISTHALTEGDILRRN